MLRKLIEKFHKSADVTPQLLLQMDGMRERNEARIQAIKQEMGENYILHPVHVKRRLEEPRPV